MGILKFLWEDLKKDWRTFKAIFQGKAKCVFTAQEFMDNVGDAAKEYYPWFLLVIAAFICGFFVASQYYEMECNEHILEVFYPWVINESLRPTGLYLYENINFTEVFRISNLSEGEG